MSKERETYVQPLHQSSINMCMRCRRAFMFRDRWCIFPKYGAFKQAASQGSLTHRLIEVGPEGVEAVRNEVEIAVNELVAAIDRGEDLMGNLAAEANNLNAMFQKALVMATILWEKYPRPEHHKVLAKEETVKAIFRLSLPDEPELTTELEGTVDEMVEDTKTGLIYIRDYKTSARDVAFTMTGYQWSFQLRLYRLLAGAYLQGTPRYENRSPQGFILEILQTPTISFGSKDRDYKEKEHKFTRGARKGETEMRREYEGEPTFENYLQRCREWYAEKGDEAVQSFSIRFNESVLCDELRGDLLMAAIARLLPAVPENFPRDATASYCKNYERVCPYYDLCCSNESGWDALIAENYEVRPPVVVPVEEETKEDE